MTLKFDTDGFLQPQKESGGREPVIEGLGITPSTSSQIITAPSGIDGYSPISVSAVTSAIDNNITAGNIKSGVTILGTTGNYTGTTPTLKTKTITQNGTYNASSDNADGYSSVTVNVSGGGGNTPPLYLEIAASVSQGKITTNGTYNAVLKTSSSVTDVGNGRDGYGLLMPPLDLLTMSGDLSIDFSSLTTVSGNYGLSYSFAYWGSRINGVSFTNLQSVTGNSAFQHTFDSMLILEASSITFPSLTTITGQKAFDGAFSNLSGISISFPSLTTVSSPIYEDEWYYSIFTQMLEGASGCTVHFPSNLQSVITNWDGEDYTNDFGGTDCQILFDLQATAADESSEQNPENWD